MAALGGGIREAGFTAGGVIVITLTTATLECEVCGAGWQVGGEAFDFRESPNWLKQLGVKFLADEPQECPECGEADAWDTVE
jgi:hypothetical protein